MTNLSTDAGRRSRAITARLAAELLAEPAAPNDRAFLDDAPRLPLGAIVAEANRLRLGFALLDGRAPAWARARAEYLQRELRRRHAA